MKFDYYTFNISGHFASAIINGDYSGLIDSDIKELDLFMDNLPVDNGHFDLINPENEGFFDKCEISGLFSECHEFRLYFPINEATA
jgi:hypothetical protein